MTQIIWLRHPEPAPTDVPAKSDFSWDWGMYLASSSDADDRPKDVL